MNRWILCLIALAPAAALADVDWRFSGRAGVQIAPYQSFDRVSENPVGAAQTLSFDRRISGPLWVGVSTTFWSADGAIFSDIDAEWDFFGVELTAMGRLRLALPLAVFGRIGPSVNRAALRLTAGDAHESVAWLPGLMVGAGVEWLPFAKTGADGVAASVGVSLEGTYRQVVPLDVALVDANLGAVDPSGPGVTLGLVAEF